MGATVERALADSGQQQTESADTVEVVDQTVALAEQALVDELWHRHQTAGPDEVDIGPRLTPEKLEQLFANSQPPTACDEPFQFTE